MFPKSFWIGALAITLMAIALGVAFASMAVIGATLKQAKAELGHQKVEIKRLRRENTALSGENKKLKETSETLGEIKTKVFEINRRRQSIVKWAALPNRGGNWVGRIDNFLARTPLAGQGRTFYLAAVDAGIEPRLMPAIAMIESGGGRANANRNNFFGRKATSTTWRAWPTPEAAIKDQAKYIRGMWGQAVSPYGMRGYATSPVWAAKVASQMRII